VALSPPLLQTTSIIYGPKIFHQVVVPSGYYLVIWQPLPKAPQAANEVHVDGVHGQFRHTGGQSQKEAVVEATGQDDAINYSSGLEHHVLWFEGSQ
jgi:hypothetical protein